MSAWVFVLICILLIYIHEQRVSLNLDERAVEPFLCILEELSAPYVFILP